MYERIKKISSIFNKEDENPNEYISKETQEKYKIFKKWLIENGAIFQKNIDFPYTYGPFHIVGCKCVSDIKDDEGILLVPKNLMIMGKDLTYINKLIQDVKDDLSDKEDFSTLFLTLNLYLEKNKKDSFFKPYIDLIFTNRDYFATWNDKTYTELHNIYTAQSIKNLLDSIDIIYNIIIKCKAFEKMTREEYSFCYFQVISRQFYLDKKNSALIPLADLLNHSSVTIHYEIYDSENMVFKYSDHFTVDEDIKIDIKPTYLKEIPIIKPTYNKLKPIIPTKERYDPNEEEESEDEDDTIVNLNINDYFCISTSLKQKMNKGSQAFNNYCDINNKSLLKYYGFALINNIFDYTDVIFQFDKSDVVIKTYLPHLFKKRFKTDLDEKYNLLKIRCEYRNVCADLIKYYQFMYYYDVNKIDDFFLYKFNYQLELASFQLAIHGLEMKLKMMEKKGTFLQDLDELENEIKKKDPGQIKVNILLYRIGQKLNVLNQIELFKSILNMFVNHKDITKYEDLFQYLNELKDISEYDNEEDAKMKIISFIDIMSKAKS
jgi:hypothetical protein